MYKSQLQRNHFYLSYVLSPKHLEHFYITLTPHMIAHLIKDSSSKQVICNFSRMTHLYNQSCWVLQKTGDKWMTGPSEQQISIRCLLKHSKYQPTTSCLRGESLCLCVLTLEIWGLATFSLNHATPVWGWRTFRRSVRDCGRQTASGLCGCPACWSGRFSGRSRGSGCWRPVRPVPRTAPPDSPCSPPTAHYYYFNKKLRLFFWHHIQRCFFLF